MAITTQRQDDSPTEISPEKSLLSSFLNRTFRSVSPESKMEAPQSNLSGKEKSLRARIAKMVNERIQDTGKRSSETAASVGTQNQREPWSVSRIWGKICEFFDKLTGDNVTKAAYEIWDALRENNIGKAEDLLNKEENVRIKNGLLNQLKKININPESPLVGAAISQDDSSLQKSQGNRPARPMSNPDIKRHTEELGETLKPEVQKIDAYIAARTSALDLKEIESMEKDAAASGTDSELESDIVSSREKIKRFEADLRPQTEEIESLSQEIGRLRKEVEDLTLRTSGERVKKSFLSKEITNLREKASRLEADLDRTQEKRKSDNIVLNETSSSIKTLEKEIDTEISALLEELLRQGINPKLDGTTPKTLMKQLCALKDSIKEKIKNNAASSAGAAEKKASAESEKTVAENTALADSLSKIDTIRTKLGKLNSLKEIRDTRNGEGTEEAEKVERLERRLGKVNANIEELNKDLESHSGLIAKHTSELETKEQALAGASANLKPKKAAAESAEAKLSEMRKNLGEKEKKLESQKTKLSGAAAKIEDKKKQRDEKIEEFGRTYVTGSDNRIAPSIRKCRNALIDSEGKPRPVVKQLLKSEDGRKKLVEQLAKTPGIGNVVLKLCENDKKLLKEILDQIYNEEMIAKSNPDEAKPRIINRIRNICSNFSSDDGSENYCELFSKMRELNCRQEILGILKEMAPSMGAVKDEDLSDFGTADIDKALKFSYMINEGSSLKTEEIARNNEILGWTRR